ncbi:hypothetical protein [Nocardia sp. NPDC056100]|uniref:DUF7257 domain-containing protein n=1 Tax=Nocardia sp. NPDC056100 TaxID=3345712 RepID=UPI0035E028B1
MTSPDKSVPSGAYTGGSIRNLQKVTWASAQASIMSTVLGSFQGVSAAGGNLNSATKQALSVANQAQTGASQAQSAAQAVQNTAAANSAALIELSANQTGQTTGGAAFSDVFGRPALGTDYSTFKTGPVADLVIVDGQVQLNRSGDNNTGDVVALSKTVTRTDDQRVSVVVGRSQESYNASAKIIVRAAADLSTFVYARVFSGSVYLGYGTRSGATTVYNDWASAQATVNTGDTVTIEAVGKNYQVLVNGAPMVGYADTAVVSPVSANNRSFGFGCQYYWSGLFPYFSFAIAALAAADLSSPPVVGTGWGLYRVSTTAITEPAGENMLAANTFDSPRPLNNVTVTDLGRGQVQVQKAGWYAINVGFSLSGTTSQARANLWTAPQVGGTWTLLRVGARTPTDTSVNTVGAAFTVFLGQGAVVAPGYTLPANAGFAGPNTYFDGALLSY